MSEGQVLYGSHDQVHVLRYIGDVRYPLAPSVARFVDGLLTDPKLQGLVIDLTQASMIDSTNLGQLARVASAMQASRGQRVTLVSDQEDINILLESMGLHVLFDIVERAKTDDAKESIEISPPTEDVLSGVILAAHRALMELSDENRARFEDVVKLLEQSSSVSRRSGTGV